MTRDLEARVADIHRSAGDSATQGDRLTQLTNNAGPWDETTA